MTGSGNPDQAIVFSQLQAPTRVTLSGNTIVVNDNLGNGFAGEGIAFQTIVGRIALGGVVNNSVTIEGRNNAAGQNWVSGLNGGNSSGTLLINGFSIP